MFRSINRVYIGGKASNQWVTMMWLSEGSGCKQTRHFSVTPFSHTHSSSNHYSIERFRDHKVLYTAESPNSSSHGNKYERHEQHEPSSYAHEKKKWFVGRHDHERDLHHQKQKIMHRYEQINHNTHHNTHSNHKNDTNGNGSKNNTSTGNGTFYPNGKDKLHISVIGSKHQNKEGYIAEEVTLQQLMEMPIDHNYSSEQGPSVWLSVSGADDETFRMLGQKFNLHPLTVEDCQSISERGREKLEVFQDYTFLIFETTHHDKKNETQWNGDACTLPEQTISIRLLVFKNCILSFHPRGVSAIASVKKKLQKVHGYHIPANAWLVHAILDGIIDAMVPVVDGVMNEISELDGIYLPADILSYEEDETDFIGKPKDKHSKKHKAHHYDQRLKRIATIRRKLLNLRQKLWPKRDILTSLINKDVETFISGVQMPYLRDVHDHLLTMLEKVERASDLLNAIQSNYLASLSINVSVQSEQLNRVMKRLTAMATICLPLSLVTGLFGMNVPVPLQPGAVFEFNDPRLFPFYGVTIVIAGSGYVLWRYFKREGFL